MYRETIRKLHVNPLDMLHNHPCPPPHQPPKRQAAERAHLIEQRNILTPVCLSVESIHETVRCYPRVVETRVKRGRFGIDPPPLPLPPPIHGARISAILERVLLERRFIFTFP